MKLAYVKMDKPKENNLLNKVKYKLRQLFGMVYKDKYENNFYINKVNKKQKSKITKLLTRHNIDFAISEAGIDIDYAKLNGRYILKYMLPEVVNYCKKMMNFKTEELYICVDEYNNENLSIINDLCNNIKVVNIITKNNRYKELERKLEGKGIYITVNNNKRKSLKKANIVINLDFKNLKDYNTNRNMIVIDIGGSLELNKSFEGIYIKEAKIDTTKVMRVFSEYEKFNRAELIEAEMLKLEEYNKVRKYIQMNKFDITEVFGKRKIENQEFQRITRTSNVA